MTSIYFSIFFLISHQMTNDIRKVKETPVEYETTHLNYLDIFALSHIFEGLCENTVKTSIAFSSFI